MVKNILWRKKMTDNKTIDFTKLLDKFHPAYFKSIDVYPGWYEIITKLDNLLSYISPDYKISQIKTKFGGLRYYADFEWDKEDPDYQTREDIFDSLIRYYESLSMSICEVCGSWGEMHDKKGWYYTACSKHKDKSPSAYLVD